MILASHASLLTQLHRLGQFPACELLVLATEVELAAEVLEDIAAVDASAWAGLLRNFVHLEAMIELPLLLLGLLFSTVLVENLLQCPCFSLHRDVQHCLWRLICSGGILSPLYWGSIRFG